MAENIEDKEPKSGRIIQEDGEVDNIADYTTTDGSGDLVLRVVSST